MFSTKPKRLNDGWSIASPAEASMDAGDLDDLTAWIRQTYEYQKLHAVLIAQAGRLVYETYLEGPDESPYQPSEFRRFDVDTLHDLQSISKSVTALLAGIAFEGDYETALATPITALLDDNRYEFDEGAERITLQHVLTMSAGYEWDAWTYPWEDPRNSNRQIYMATDPIAALVKMPLEFEPGSHWEYNNGLTELLAAILERRTGQRIDAYAREVLFDPLGINRFEWWGQENWQPAGWPSAAGGLRLRARDLARIGWLVQNGGAWQGQQIVPVDWIRRCTESHMSEAWEGPRGNYGYGYQWWIGHSNSIPRYNIVAGFGNGGQQLLLVPERQLVVVVFAGNYGRYNHALFNWVLDRVVFAHRPN